MQAATIVTVASVLCGLVGCWVSPGGVRRWDGADRFLHCPDCEAWCCPFGTMISTLCVPQTYSRGVALRCPGRVLTCEVLVRKDVEVRDLEAGHRRDADPEAEHNTQTYLLDDAEAHLAKHQGGIYRQVAVHGRRVSWGQGSQLPHFNQNTACRIGMGDALDVK